MSRTRTECLDIANQRRRSYLDQSEPRAVGWQPIGGAFRLRALLFLERAQFSSTPSWARISHPPVVEPRITESDSYDWFGILLQLKFRLIYSCIGFPGFSNSPHPRRLVWHTYVITFLIIFHPINAESFIYEGYIGPLPPYPFLTFTLMQLLLYVFFPFAYHSYMNDLDHTYVYE